MQNWIKAAVIAVSLALPGVALAQSLESLVNVQVCVKTNWSATAWWSASTVPVIKTRSNSPTRPSPICCASLACSCRIKSTRR